MNDRPIEPPSSALDELSGVLRKSVVEVRGIQPPAEALNRVVDRAILLGARSSRITQPGRRVRLRTLWAIATAAAVLVAAAVWLMLPGDSWAQVVKAVQMQPWVHDIAKTPDGKQRMDHWISFPRGISGQTKADGSAIFDNEKTKVRLEYQPGEGPDKLGVLTREPLPAFVAKDGNSLEAMFCSAMQGETSLHAESVFGMKTVSQERRTTVENGKSWIDYDFVLSMPSRDEKIHFVFRVDPETNLPASMRLAPIGGNSKSEPVANPPDGKNPIVEVVFEYPAENAGPRDIYDLGVPRAAKVVDRMPSAELADVIAGVEASEMKFGSYFAVAVRTTDDFAPWRAPWVYVMWRDGKKCRFENAICPRDKFDTSLAKPEAGTNMVAWWKARLKVFNGFPRYVSDGKTWWEPQGSSIFDTPLVKMGNLSEDDDGSHLSLGVTELVMPDLAGYHRAPHSGKNVEASLLPNLSDGPPNCIWVEVRYTDPKTQKPTGFTRLCFDTEHSYLLRRYQWYNLTDQPERKSPSTAHSIDEFAQAPSGVWYPTCVHEDGGTVIYYYVDFNAKLPAGLFKPEPRTGDIE